MDGDGGKPDIRRMHGAGSSVPEKAGMVVRCRSGARRVPRRITRNRLGGRWTDVLTLQEAEVTLNDRSEHRSMRMTGKYEFTLVLAGVADITEELEDSLYEAGCDDALLGKRNGAVFLDFIRASTSFEDAVISAINQVESCGAGLEVAGVEPALLVNQSEIARRLGITRESVRLMSEGKRRAGMFPPPVTGVKSNSPLWNWAVLLTDIGEDMGTDFTEQQKAAELSDIILALDIRRNRNRLHRVASVLKRLGVPIKLRIHGERL